MRLARIAAGRLVFFTRENVRLMMLELSDLHKGKTEEKAEAEMVG